MTAQIIQLRPPIPIKKVEPVRSCTECVHAFIGIQGLWCDVFNDLQVSWAADDCAMWETEFYDGGEL